jgi:hypothetical protein
MGNIFVLLLTAPEGVDPEEIATALNKFPCPESLQDSIEGGFGING